MKPFVSMKTVSALLLSGALLAAGALRSDAATLTYTEVIKDLTAAPMVDWLDLDRDLQRTRTLGDGTVLVEDLDATIVAENAVSDTWGFGTFLPFALNHVLVADSVARFLSATLTLEVFGVDGSLADLVFVDFPFPVGALTANGDAAMSTTVLTTDILGDPDLIDFVLGLMLADNTMAVATLPLLPDFMSIRSSTMKVTYETAVPEPSTALLFFGSLFALGGRQLLRHHRR